jgi:dihydrofolate reductase
MKITAGMFLAIDGVVQAPDQWQFPYFNDEMGQAVDAQLGAADTILLGRKTYDSFAGAGWCRNAGSGGRRRGGRRLRQEARRRQQDRRVEPEPRVHVAKFGAAQG